MSVWQALVLDQPLTAHSAPYAVRKVAGPKA
jgi:hypothetical protein